jgi:hypothetical protein
MIVHPIVLVSSSSILRIPESSDLIKAMDDAIRSDLQSFSDSFFWLALVSSAFVVIGVALEGPELLHELWPKTFSVFAKRWVKKIGLIGWLLVVLGVGGEVIFGLLENKAQGLLQTFNEILLVDAQRQAGDAKTSAEGAAEAAHLAQDSAKAANSVAGTAQQKADAANITSGKAQYEASAVAKKAAELDRQLAATKAQLRTIQQEADQAHNLLAWLAPRDVAITFRKDEFVQYLHQFKGQHIVITVCGGQFIPRGDQELMNTAQALRVALPASQWEVQEPIVVDESCRTIGEGASVFEREDAPKETREAARTLEAVLDDVLLQTIPVLDVKKEGYSVNGQAYGADDLKVEVRMHPLRPTGPSPDDAKLLRAKTP